MDFEFPVKMVRKWWLVSGLLNCNERQAGQSKTGKIKHQNQQRLRKQRWLLLARTEQSHNSCGITREALMSCIIIIMTDEGKNYLRGGWLSSLIKSIAGKLNIQGVEWKREQNKRSTIKQLHIRLASCSILIHPTMLTRRKYSSIKDI